MKLSASVLLLALSAASQITLAQTIDPLYSGCYTFRDLGSPPGVPTSLGGINFLPGDPNVLLISGGANLTTGAVYRITLIRDANNAIVGFSDLGAFVSNAARNDGGLAVAPNGTLFVTTYPTTQLLQIPTGSTDPASALTLTDLGITGSGGSCQFVPAGFPGEGRLKVVTWGSSTWYDVEISDPVSGVYTITRPNPTAIAIGSGPEGIAFVGAGNPAFTRASCIVCKYNTGSIVTYELDANGDPDIGTQRTFMTGLTGAEGGVRDPLTGSFLFSTFGGGNRIIIVEGFNRDCRANFNADCAIDFFDYLDFLSAFTSGASEGDFNHDDVVDFFDYLDFVQAFSSGC